MRTQKNLESGIVFGMLLVILTGICLAPSLGLARENVLGGKDWGDPGDALGNMESEGEPKDGLDSIIDRETGDPVDGLDLTTNYTICYPAETNPELEIWLFFQCCLIPW